MASCDEVRGFDDDKPTVSPLISRYLVLSWAMLIEWEIDFKLKNFEVVEFKLDPRNKKDVVCEKFKNREMALSKFDNFIVQHLLQNQCRVWFKAIGELVNNDDQGCLLRGQKGFLCVQMSNKLQEYKVVGYLGHQRYCVRIKKEYPW